MGFDIRKQIPKKSLTKKLISASLVGIMTATPMVMSSEIFEDSKVAKKIEQFEKTDLGGKLKI